MFHLVHWWEERIRTIAHQYLSAVVQRSFCQNNRPTFLYLCHMESLVVFRSLLREPIISFCNRLNFLLTDWSKLLLQLIISSFRKKNCFCDKRLDCTLQCLYHNFFFPAESMSFTFVALKTRKNGFDYTWQKFSFSAKIENNFCLNYRLQSSTGVSNDQTYNNIVLSVKNFAVIGLKNAPTTAGSNPSVSQPTSSHTLKNFPRRLN